MFIESLKARFIIISLSLILGCVYFIPNFVEDSSFLPSKNKLIYGLDIQGGLHLVLSADVNEILQERLSRTAFDIKEGLKKNKILASTLVTTNTFQIIINLEKKEDLKSAQQWIKESDILNRMQILKAQEGEIKLAYYDSRIRELKESAIQQSIEVIRNRIDEFGVSEPVITAQGEDRILVQLPGIEDSKRAKDLIQRTARLELAIVNAEFPPEKLFPLIERAEKKGAYSLEEKTMNYREYIKRINADLKNEFPENHRLLFQKAPTALTIEAGRIPYLVDMNQSIQGGLLEDASVAFNPDTNNPLVSFRFQPEGRKVFSNLTGNSIGKALAVILDGVIKSAPTVQSRIQDRGEISLGTGDYESMLEEANMIATSLRAGALPTQLYQLEEKTVGPTLGKDAIDRGKKAGAISLFLVILFMFFYYKSLGVVANICLLTNLFFLLALMSSLSATLTLPGVAGIILTIGMAVDANVIIFERIKEELRKGASLKLAIKDGYGNAFSAILDANITTAIVCFVLIYFSSGAVKGFAVTLFCGILSSLWTAVFISRTLMDFLVLRFNWTKI
ncbi:MAG: protein translocase subunit SecD [Bdellovibrionales bacterium]|nr:protein translocase subunit SecD [Bdellovibrionales bacterium]